MARYFHAPECLRNEAKRKRRFRFASAKLPWKACIEMPTKRKRLRAALSDDRGTNMTREP
jgi:hypothetical protein